ncbi:hypothetical protein POM88_006267 [Heracleum sosnowskyi]|uniref:Bulb-type lectin domain-containing protein n=1 Tax=Heracleum sosnowskyi TaxID=360622 RepID=A0AAD8J400_9APIA|nr:hypothetical protein POM88_006267 [Heracleum sosnowskyi]
MAVDTIRPHQTFRDGDTIISAGGEFELGFFSPGSSKSRYLGICSDGIIWSSYPRRTVKNPAFQLLDTGNLVLRDADHDIKNEEDFIWKSFDYPGDNLLPGMKFGVDLESGIRQDTDCDRYGLCGPYGQSFAYADARKGGHGCLLWFGNLIDIRDYTEDGQDIFVRMPSSELVKSWSSRVKRKILVILIPAISIVGKPFSNLAETLKIYSKSVALAEIENVDLELPLFDLKRIANATSNFSNNSKLGEGSFRPVYKGTLGDGQEIAVKRLSKNSSQGLNEFKNHY